MNDKPGPRVVLVTTTDSEPARAILGNYEPAVVKDEVSLPPLHQGLVGRYWQTNLTALRQNFPGRADATVACWIVEAPWAHPIWHSYSLILVHLRPLPGLVGDTVIYLPGATHEVWLHAQNPDKPREPHIRGRESPLAAGMTPKQFAAQFIAPTDIHAQTLCQAALQEVCAGVLSPDSARSHQLEWAKRFGANMLREQPQP